MGKVGKVDEEVALEAEADLEALAILQVSVPKYLVTC